MTGRDRSAGGEVAHEARAILLALVAERTPEPHRSGVVGSDDRVDAERPALSQASLPLSDELRRNPSPPMTTVDGETEEAAAPAVPRDDQRADELPVGMREQERARVVVEERCERLDVVAHRRRRSRPRPDRENVLDVVARAIAELRHAR